MLDLDGLDEEEDIKECKHWESTKATNDHLRSCHSWHIQVDVRVSWGGCCHSVRPKEECRGNEGGNNM